MKREIFKYAYPDGTRRNVYVLLPNKLETNTRLRTLYMFDGEATIIESEYSKENWGVVEAIEAKGITDLAVVAMDHAGDERMQEYLPFDLEYEGKSYTARGKEFSEWLKYDLIPYLESKYHFDNNRQSRYLAGSSMGGIITASFSSILKDTFSKFGVFSLASFIFPENSFYDFLDKYVINNDSSYYLYVGDKEGYYDFNDTEDEKITKSYIDEFNRFNKYLKTKNIMDVKTRIGKNCNHSEKSWKTYLPEFVEMLK